MKNLEPSRGLVAKEKQKLQDVIARLRKASALVESSRAELGQLTEMISHDKLRSFLLKARCELSDSISTIRTASAWTQSARNWEGEKPSEEAR